MILDPEISQQLIAYLSKHDDPVSIIEAIKLIQSVCPESDTEDVMFYILCVDGNGQAVSDNEFGIPTVIMKADWLVI